MTKPDAAPAASDADAIRSASTTVARATVVMMMMILASRITGIGKMMVIAHLFGKTAQTDAYTSAFTIPDFIFFLVSGGALATGFVPVFTEFLSRGRYRQARRTFRTLATVLTVVLTIVIAACWIFAPMLVAAVFPGFRTRPETLSLTVRLTRIILPAQLFFVIGGLFAGTLNALRYFIVPASQPVIYNVGIILGGICLHRHFGIAGLAWGALTGAIVGSVIIQVPVLVRLGLPFRPLWDLSDEGLRKVVSLIAPIILGLSIAQINAILLPRSFASMLPAGATTSIEYANRLMQMPVSMFASGMAIAILPSLSDFAARERFDQIRAAVSQATRVVLLLAIPSTVILMVLPMPIIRLLLQHGDFNAQDTVSVAGTLMCYAIGIVGMSVQQVVSRGFYAMQDTITPVYVGLASIGVFLVSAHFLIGPMAERGLALSASLSALVSAVLLTALLARNLAGLELRRIWFTTWRCMAGAALLGVASAASYHLLSAHHAQPGIGREAMATLGAILIGVVAYAAAMVALRVPEAAVVVRRLNRRRAAA